MTIAAVDEPREAVSFRDALAKSKLVGDEQLAGVLSRQPTLANDPEALAEALTAAGYLTVWQRDKLLEGRYKGFFLGKYRILAQIGAGAMGSVFLGEHKVMRHKVAIKVLAKRLVGRDTYIRRFEQEARAAAAVNHPRVVRAFDFDSSDDVHYLVMEFAEGEDLQKIVTRDGVLPIPVVAQCVMQTAEGLAAAHDAGLIHRDIKPSNLLVDPKGDVRILDLGLARIVDDDEPSLTLVHDSKMIGTVDYLAPEQARNSHHIDCRADLYSLGCTMYFLLAGRPPFDDGTLTQRVIEHQTKLPVDIRQRRRDCPAELAFICHKLLAKKPEERFQTAQEVVDAMRHWLDRYEGRAPSGSGSSLLVKGLSPEDLQPLVPGDDLSILHDTETMANLETSASSAGGSKGSRPGASQGSGGDAGLALSDESVLSSGPPSKLGHSGSKSASSTSKSGSGTRPKTAAKVTALDADELRPLTSQDSLVQLLADELPEALVSTAPLPRLAGNPLAPTAGDSEPASGLHSDAYRRALAEAEGAKPQTLWESFATLVREEGPGGVSYSVYFLAAAGILLGLIVCAVGYSYYLSTRGVTIDQNRNFEGGNMPPAAAPSTPAPPRPEVPSAAPSVPVAPPSVAPKTQTPVPAAPPVPGGTKRRLPSRES
jgi:serine/threonine protein kinase